MNGEQRMKAMRKVEAALARGLPLCWACREAGVSEASYRRWRAKAPDGDPAALADAPRPGRPPKVAWSAESVEFVKRLYIRSNLRRNAGSAALAWRMAAKDPSSPLTPEERAYVLDRPGKDVPKSAREALRDVSGNVFARYRDPRAGEAREGIFAPGWLRMREDGSRRLLPGERQVWDDASVNVGVVVPWSRGGDPCSDRFGVRVARFQLLAGIDCATDFCVGTSYVMRPQDGYRAEDVVRAMLSAWQMQGFMPESVVLEGGSWYANRTLDFLEAAGVRRVSAMSNPNQKLVEGWFNRLWTVMSVELPPSGQVGRFRGEMKKENDLWTAVRKGERDPRGIFPDMKEFLRALDRSVAYLNADKVRSREYGSWIPAEKWEAARPGGAVPQDGRPVPKWLWRWSLPVNAVVSMRRGGMVSVRATCPFGWGHDYMFALADGWRFPDGTKMRVMFDPWRIREGAVVETADGRTTVAEAAPCVSPAPDPEAERCWLDPRA
ncbi:MAG: helix-turn-helix domain-containing protein, partial [Kiritimatiellae bacterium]|nr:helix-turn-helix domain-containing protein [Kiritimatiellia bacterium]